MKKLFVALSAAALVAATLAPAARAVEVEGDAYIGYFDKYLWRGFDLSGSLPVIQGGVDLSAYGFTVSYWSNYQTRDDEVEGFESGEITETDIVLDYTFNPHEKVSVSVGNIFYQLEGLLDTNELYLGLGLDTVLSPAVTLYWDYDEADEDGYFVIASVGQSFDLMEGLSASLGAAVSYNGASDFAVGNYHDWHNYELSVGLDYALTEELSISPSFLYSSGLSDDAKKAIDSETVAGVNLTFAF